MTNGPTTLDELAAVRRDRDLPTFVHVVGYPDRDPPMGIATAKRVSALIAGEGGLIRERGKLDELGDGDVALFVIDEPPRRSNDTWWDLYKLSVCERALFLAGIVVFAEELPPRIDPHIDARVWAKSGGVDRVERLRFDPFAYEVFSTDLDGLVG